MTNKLNQQAFPVQKNQDDGMTLLDYFAAKAMQATIIATANQADRWTIEEKVKDYYFVAKVMLLEREKIMKELNND